MSHFPAYVLVPEKTENIELKVIELLDPYDDGLEVDPYETECDCVQFAALERARELCLLQFGSFEAAGEAFNKLMTQQPDADRKVEWARFMKERDELIDAEMERQLPSMVPDSGCEECDGKGFVTSTCNKNAKWDWWEIGGGWDSMLKDSWKDESHRYRNGKLAHIDDLDLDRLPIPFAIVTPDGTWHAQGDMTWFGRMSKLDEEWESKAKAILSENKDCILVVVDCHAA